MKNTLKLTTLLVLCVSSIIVGCDSKPASAPVTAEQNLIVPTVGQKYRLAKIGNAQADAMRDKTLYVVVSASKTSTSYKVDGSSDAPTTTSTVQFLKTFDLEK